MFSKTEIVKMTLKGVASKLPEGSKSREIAVKLSSVDVGVAAKELLVIGAGKGRSLVAEMAQKAADALSDADQQQTPADIADHAEVKPTFSGVVHDLVVWSDSHLVTMDGEVIVITSVDGQHQTRLNIRSAGDAPRNIQAALNLRIHEIVMGKEPK